MENNNEIDNLIKPKRGRPKMIKNIKPIEPTTNINKSDTEEIINKVYPEVIKKGRPLKIISEEDKLKIEQTQRLRPLRNEKLEKIIKSPEQLKIERKLYYDNNKEKFNADMVCEICNIKIQKCNKFAHCNGKRHNLLKSKLELPITI